MHSDLSPNVNIEVSTKCASVLLTEDLGHNITPRFVSQLMHELKVKEIVLLLPDTRVVERPILHGQ